MNVPGRLDRRSSFRRLQRTRARSRRRSTDRRCPSTFATKERSHRQLEGLRAMRLQAERFRRCDEWSRARRGARPAIERRLQWSCDNYGSLPASDRRRFRDWRHRRFDAARGAGFIVQTVEAPPGCIAGRRHLPRFGLLTDEQIRRGVHRSPTLPPPPRRSPPRKPLDVLATTTDQRLQFGALVKWLKSADRHHHSAPSSASRLLTNETASRR